MSDQKMCDSGELDLNFADDGEERAEGYVCGNLATENGIQVDLNKLQVSPLLPVGFRKKNLRSSNDKSHCVPTDFDQDDARRTKIDYDQERTQSPSSDNHYQGEMDEFPGSYFHKSSFEFKAQTFHHERRTEGSAHSQESPMTAASNEVEETECNPNVDRPKCPQDENMKETLLEKSAYEFNNSPNEQNDGEAIEHETRKLSSNPISPSGDDEGEGKNEKHHHKRYFPSGSRKIDMPHSVPHSPRSSHERSTSTLMEKPMLFSAAGSLQIHLSSNGHRPLSLHEGVSDQLHSPATCRLHLYSPERSELAKRISSHGHSSAPARQTSASPRKSRQGSRYKNSSSLKCKSSSPEPHCPPKKHQKHNRSMSRSHVRRRDSTSGYGRDYRGRSRSRSPYAGDHYRSPRRRYSPRQRSPPGYYPRHQSPRRRPWSPPPNRRTGVGKPGKNLFVAGFSFLTTERDLERKFSRFGQVRDVRIVRDKRSGDSRGFGFLSLERDEDADAAIRALDETEWNGRIILVEKSKSTR